MSNHTLTSFKYENEHYIIWRKTLRLSGSNNHEYCVIDEVCKLMERGYDCYPEYEIWIGPSKTKRGYRAVVDIYAIRGKQEIIVEVGTLSPSHGDRIFLLQKLKPNAKIVHVHQWKNYGINEDIIWRRHLEYSRIMQSWSHWPELRDERLRDLEERLYF